ncbi:unnamed protein product [Ectocarpus fasciculatus]
MRNNSLPHRRYLHGVLSKRKNTRETGNKMQQQQRYLHGVLSKRKNTRETGNKMQQQQHRTPLREKYANKYREEKHNAFLVRCNSPETPLPVTWFCSAEQQPTPPLLQPNACRTYEATTPTCKDDFITTFSQKVVTRI